MIFYYHPNIKFILVCSLLAVLNSYCNLACENTGKSRSDLTKPRANVPDGDYLLMIGDSLDGWEVTDFGTQGPVYARSKIIFLGMGEGCTGITWRNKFPTIDYEICLDAKRISGHDFFCGLTFPVKDEFCSLIVGGWGGPVVGLSSIDGLDASENEWSSLKKFITDQWYHIQLRVTRDSIRVWIDGDCLVNFCHTGHKLSVRAEVEPSRPFGITSWTTTAALSNIILHYLKKEQVCVNSE